MSRSILIADDEELIRKGIIARLEYLELNPTHIYEAGNGVEALEIIRKNQINIAIVDIQMPYMDGLEFIKQAKLINPNIRFIILSGYAEFKYAEQAIQFGVQDYLLKPISNDALEESIKKAYSILDEREKFDHTISEGKRFMVEKKRYEFEKAINDLLRSTRESAEAKNAYEKVNEKFSLGDRWFVLGIINIDGENFEQRNFAYEEIENVQATIKKVFTEVPSESDKVIVENIVNPNQLYAILASYSKSYLRKQSEIFFTQLQRRVWNTRGISLTIGVSSEKDVLSVDCVKEAKEALLQRMIHGNFNLYFYDDIKLLSDSEYPISKINLLRQYIERRDITNLEVLINDIFSNEQIKKYSTTYIRAVWINIVSILLKETNTVENDSENINKLVIDYDKLDSFNSLDEIRSYLYTLILDYIQIDDIHGMNSKDKIKLAVKYINDNYNEEISVKDLAEKFDMSPNYFSSVFKRETGETTMNYVNNIRIQKACDYLLNSDKSVVDISKEIGFEDSQYFFRVFKKSTGQTPLQYKRNHS